MLIYLCSPCYVQSPNMCFVPFKKKGGKFCFCSRPLFAQNREASGNALLSFYMRESDSLLVGKRILQVVLLSGKSAENFLNREEETFFFISQTKTVGILIVQIPNDR